MTPGRSQCEPHWVINLTHFAFVRETRAIFHRDDTASSSDSTSSSMMDLISLKLGKNPSISATIEPTIVSNFCDINNGCKCLCVARQGANVVRVVD